LDFVIPVDSGLCSKSTALAESVQQRPSAREFRSIHTVRRIEQVMVHQSVNFDVTHRKLDDA
jgi:hypothetical protein